MCVCIFHTQQRKRKRNLRKCCRFALFILFSPRRRLLLTLLLIRFPENPSRNPLRHRSVSIRRVFDFLTKPASRIAEFTCRCHPVLNITFQISFVKNSRLLLNADLFQLKLVDNDDADPFSPSPLYVLYFYNDCRFAVASAV